MIIPAIQAKIGNWKYYVTTLSFGQIEKHVSRVDDELHKSKTLKDMIQRSITNNYISIKEYILNQPELFFNSLVLAVYNDYPEWREIEFKYGENETYEMGLLDFSGKHKIFPVDGQHRVEGIKAALKENPELASERVSVIFIGHSNELEGMQKTRRLFSTLNRYAKPVTMDDTIALDEDDSIAIVTRELLETFNLFTETKVTKSGNKAIADNDKEAFTSIITLYQCNKELLKLFRENRKRSDINPDRDKKKLEVYLKFRPKEIEIELFTNFCFEYWEAFRDSFDVVQSFLSKEDEQPALEFRNKENGGNLLFRPVGLLPIIQASIEIHKRTELSFRHIFEILNRIDLTISNRPWRNVVWNPNEHTMIMGTTMLVKLFILYIFGRNIIKNTELSSLKSKYADKINSDNPNFVLDDIVIQD